MIWSLLYFNTSNVINQPVGISAEAGGSANFNTSNVINQRIHQKVLFDWLPHFNTSNVINQLNGQENQCLLVIEFQYI